VTPTEKVDYPGFNMLSAISNPTNCSKTSHREITQKVHSELNLTIYNKLVSQNTLSKEGLSLRRPPIKFKVISLTTDTQISNSRNMKK
jgi:hypothetical protein